MLTLSHCLFKTAATIISNRCHFPVFPLTPTFFPTLGCAFPKLKVLELDSIYLDITVGYEKIIDKQDPRLQRVSLTSMLRRSWLVVVKTHKGCVRIKIHDDKMYKVFDYKSSPENTDDKYCISCYDIEELILGGEKITLYSDRTTSNIASNDED